MECSQAGFQVWIPNALFFVVASAGVVLFLLAPRQFQGWLRMHRNSPMIRGAPESFFGAWGIWAIRATGIIWALMWTASATGVYCLFSGPS